jgi:hypothetical protein
MNEAVDRKVRYGARRGKNKNRRRLLFSTQHVIQYYIIYVKRPREKISDTIP